MKLYPQNSQWDFHMIPGKSPGTEFSGSSYLYGGAGVKAK